MGPIVGQCPISRRALNSLFVALVLARMGSKVVTGTELKDEAYELYKGHTLIRSLPSTTAQLNALKDIEKGEIEGVQVWKGAREVSSPVDLLVAPGAKDEIVTKLKEHNIVHNASVDHVYNLLLQHKRHRRSISVGSARKFDLHIYHNYEEIMDWMDGLGRSCGDRCKVFSIGKTYENRDLKVIKIGKAANKPVIWLDGGIHAREWVAPATVLWIINKLLDVNDTEGRFLLDRYIFYILPLINADGYAYTWAKDRMWRKTRSLNANTRCRGTDPNRNWDYMWGGEGASTNPCSESYRGSRPFSEIETRTMAAFYMNLTRQHTVPIYISLHSYGQYFLTSWGYSDDVPHDYNELIAVARTATQEMFRVHGETYKFGSSGRLLYAAAGGSDDWAKGVAGTKYSYTVELRDTGMYGFVLPDSEIRPTAEEFMAGLKSVARSVHRTKRYHRRLRQRRRH